MNKNYLVKIRDFLKYGFTDENYSLLGASKLGKFEGKNDGDFCPLVYKLPESTCLVKKKEKKRKKG